MRQAPPQPALPHQGRPGRLGQGQEVPAGAGRQGVVHAGGGGDVEDAAGGAGAEALGGAAEVGVVARVVVAAVGIRFPGNGSDIFLNVRQTKNSCDRSDHSVFFLFMVRVNPSICHLLALDEK